jgi:cell division topological specificity factor
MITAVSSGGWRAAFAQEGLEMASMFQRLFGREKKSAHQAKERLKLVLIHDRTDLNAGTLDVLKDELIAVISRHVDIDPSAVRIEMAQDGRQQRLIADIPLNPSNRRRSRIAGK